MPSKELWERTLDQWFEEALERYRASEEWKYHRAMGERAEQERRNEFTEEQNQLIEEWLEVFRLGRDAESLALYREGFRDCLALLRRALLTTVLPG